jgi:hypothetical protein
LPLRGQNALLFVLCKIDFDEEVQLKKYLFITFLSAFITTTSAFASFSGNWKGVGKITDSQGNENQCPMMEIVLEHLPEALNVNKVEFKCTNKTYMWMPSTLVIDDGKLYSEGHQVGTIDANVISAVVPLLWQDTGEWGQSEYVVELFQSEKSEWIFFDEKRKRTTGKVDFEMTGKLVRE